MTNKVVPIRDVANLERIDCYCQDPLHPRHLHVKIGSRELHGDLNKCPSLVFKYYDIAEENARRNKRYKPGPDSEILGYHVMVRNAPVRSANAALTPDEYESLPRLLHAKLKRDMVSDIHLHPTGDVDWHFLIFGLWARKPSPGLIVRRCIDEIHGELNEGRRQVGRPVLSSVEDRRLEKLALREFDPLAIQLALRHASTIAELPIALMELGHQLGPGGIDAPANKVHVIHCHSPDSNSFAYNLRRLLDDVRKAMEYLEASETPRLDAVEETVGVDLDR